MRASHINVTKGVATPTGAYMLLQGSMYARIGMNYVYSDCDGANTAGRSYSPFLAEHRDIPRVLFGGPTSRRLCQDHIPKLPNSMSVSLAVYDRNADTSPTVDTERQLQGSIHTDEQDRPREAPSFQLQ